MVYLFGFRFHQVLRSSGPEACDTFDFGERFKPVIAWIVVGLDLTRGYVWSDRQRAYGITKPGMRRHFWSKASASSWSCAFEPTVVVLTSHRGQCITKLGSNRKLVGTRLAENTRQGL